MFKKKEFFIILALIIVFIFLRVFRIEESLLFFNDIGRDFLVLFNWADTGKPPLLGPQTSVLPFNQSAIYFYLLFPFYLLTGHSAYASLIALLVFYLAFFAAGIYFLRKDKKLRYSLYLVFLLLSIHPEYIKQARFTWNPSFVTPFLLTAFYSFIYLKKDFQKKKKLNWKLLFIFALSISAATAFSYSTVPAFFAFFILSVFYFKKEIWKLIISLGTSLFTLNLATVAFEIRHKFPLSKMLFTRKESSQLSNNLINKLANLNKYTLNFDSIYLIIFFFILFILLYSSLKKSKKTELKDALLLLLLTLIISFLVPIKIHSHYVFAFLSLFFIILSFLKKKLLLIIPLLFFWLRPVQLDSYFQRAIRTVAESEQCAQSFCQNHQETILVSGQSSYLPSHHNAMEWQYFFSEAGCQVKDLVRENHLSNHMAVVIDDSNYEHGKTKFNELSIFGESEEIEQFICSDKIKIHYLEKIK